MRKRCRYYLRTYVQKKNSRSDGKRHATILLKVKKIFSMKLPICVVVFLFQVVLHIEIHVSSGGVIMATYVLARPDDEATYTSVTPSWKRLLNCWHPMVVPWWDGLQSAKMVMCSSSSLQFDRTRWQLPPLPSLWWGRNHPRWKRSRKCFLCLTWCSSEWRWCSHKLQSQYSGGRSLLTTPFLDVDWFGNAIEFHCEWAHLTPKRIWLIVEFFAVLVARWVGFGVVLIAGFARRAAWCCDGCCWLSQSHYCQWGVLTADSPVPVPLFSPVILSKD